MPPSKAASTTRALIQLRATLESCSSFRFSPPAAEAIERIDHRSAEVGDADLRPGHWLAAMREGAQHAERREKFVAPFRARRETVGAKQKECDIVLPDVSKPREKVRDDFRRLRDIDLANQ